MSKFVPAPHVWMVAVPETAGVHWKTCSGEPTELSQVPASELVPLVAPLKVPPCAGMTVGVSQGAASARDATSSSARTASSRRIGHLIGTRR